jgi:hypothetical protein
MEQLGRIYKVFVPGMEEICYVGSTYESLLSRMSKHKHSSNNSSQNKCRSCKLFEDGNEPVIELLEEDLWTKEELITKEREWIGKFPDALNHNIPGRTWQERWELNRERNLALHKIWLEKHKEEQVEYRKIKREADLEAAHEKDKRSNQNRDKEKRNAWKSAKVTCGECNLIMSRNNFPTHKKNKHKEKEVSYTLVVEE